MDINAWLGQLPAFLQRLAGTVVDWAFAVFRLLSTGVLSALRYLWGLITRLGWYLARIAAALQKLGHSNLIQTLIRWYQWFIKWVLRIQRAIFGPIERLRQLILQIYNIYFRPIIQMLDALRRIVQIIAIFNRRLAAQLDQAILRLEALVLAPVTVALTRLNALSSYFTAVVTRLGLFDRTTLISSIWRDASIILRDLVNPLRKAAPQNTAQPGRDAAQASQAVHDWAYSQGGDYAPTILQSRQTVLDTIALLGGK
jgi:hypothetical protein